MKSDSREVHLVGDIGATNARFALAEADGTLTHFVGYLCSDFGNLDAAIAAYLKNVGASQPDRAVIAVATTPDDDQVRFTNNPWSFSITDLAQRTGIGDVQVINDFHANALALPHLQNEDVLQIGGGDPVAHAPMAVLGPGSGLGVSACVWSGERFIALPGEGGHVTMPATDSREAAVLDILRARFGHVSAERLLSGPGITNIYAALCTIDGLDALQKSPADICQAALANTDARAAEAIAMFCAMLGTVAGDIALTLGCRGGIFIAGGIVPRLGATFAASPFRQRFEAKGRFSGYLAAIPTYVITRPDAALIGAAALARECGGSL